MIFRFLHIISFILCIMAAHAAVPPIMGWSSWNTYRVDISDSLIMRQADAMVELGLDSAGYRYVNIDDGYSGGRDMSTGRLTFHPKRFPHGLKPVVEHIHQLGLKAGIYSDAGANTCGNFWDNDSLGQNTGLYGHDTDDCRMLFGELGFDFIKVDFCGGDPKQNTQHLQLNPQQRYREIRRAIDATGRTDVRMNVCRWDYPGTWVRDVADSWRTTSDISCSWESVKSIIAENLYLSAYAGNGHHNDMDMLEVGRSLTHEEDRTHMGIWCMMASPLLIGCDLTQLRPESLRLLKNHDLIALNQDSAGMQAYVTKADRGTYILVRDLTDKNGTERAVAFYNPTDSARVMWISLYDISLAGLVKVRDLMEQTDCDDLTGGLLIAEVPAHGTKIYRLKADRRLFRTKYEAETAFLPTYQELENPIATGTAYYREDARCSGGMCAAQLGGTQHNCLIWENVIVPADGFYDLAVSCLSDTPTHFFLTGNGMGHKLTTTGSSDVQRVTARVYLHAGPNRITIFNHTAPIPDIDCMEIRL